MSSYTKGRRFEYRVRDLFRKNGYVVIRAARSKPIDLVCLKNGNSILVECKTEKSALRKPRKEILLDLAKTSKAIPILAYKKQRKIKLIDVRTNDAFLISKE